MTYTRLTSRMAAAAGEPLSVTSRLGFPWQSATHDGRDSGDILDWAVLCPHCARPVCYPGRSRDGSNPMAECEDCDVYFHFEDDDVISAAARRDGKHGHRSPPPVAAEHGVPARDDGERAERHPIGGGAPHGRPHREHASATRPTGPSARDLAPAHQRLRDRAGHHAPVNVSSGHGGGDRCSTPRPSAFRRGRPPLTRSMAPAAPPIAPGFRTGSLSPGAGRFAARRSRRWHL